LPHVARIAAKYQPLGVKFLSVTDEEESDIADVQEVVDGVEGFTWPSAYGGMVFSDALGVSAIPTIALFGRDGRCLWSSHGTYGLEPALDAALAADP
jgi:hypothetical protein